MSIDRLIAYVSLSFVAGLMLLLPASAADEPSTAQPAGAVLFSDDFERDEATPDKEDIGPGWRSNSAWRAQGRKQVDLDGGAMHITRVPEADHGVAIFHDVEFQDGSVELKFKLGPGDDLGIDFVDRELKTVHAGHLCIARVKLNGVSLSDSKTGTMDLKIREQRQSGKVPPEVAALLKTKTINFPLKLEADQWHHMRVTVEADTMSVAIDGKPVGQFQSVGIAHPTKRMITLAVNKSAWVDDVVVRRIR